MKKKLSFTLIILVFVMMFSVNAFAASKKIIPETVKLNKIASLSYSKIGIKWKKSSNSTHYRIYYKKAGTSKWIRIATVNGQKDTYIHTSSKNFPITVGQKYTYTVKGYNSKYKTYGKCDLKGMTSYTKPSMVTMKSAVLSSDKNYVSVSWNKAYGCNYYCIYRKTSSSGWKRIANIKTGTTKFVDQNPVKGQQNFYMVRGYYSPTKIYGDYSKKFPSVLVPGNDSSQNTDQAKYKYEIKLLNPYPEIYNTTSGAPIFYIKTNNPNQSSIKLYSNPNITTITGLQENTFGDVKGTWAGNWLKVTGGYICMLEPENAGIYEIQVREVKEKYIDQYLYIDSSLAYCYPTDASISFQVKDYKQEGIKWIQGLIEKYTTPSMTPKEKFEAIIYGEFTASDSSGAAKYRYSAVTYNESYGRYVYTELLTEHGTIWQNHRLNSYTSPRLMCDIGNLVGYNVRGISTSVNDPMHAYVKGPDGSYYMICPFMESGIVDPITPFDFSKY